MKLRRRSRPRPRRPRQALHAKIPGGPAPPAPLLRPETRSHAAWLRREATSSSRSAQAAREPRRAHGRNAAVYLRVADLDVAEGETGDHGGPLGVGENKGACDPVFGFEGVVGKQPTSMLPAGLGVDDPGGTAQNRHCINPGGSPSLDGRPALAGKGRIHQDRPTWRERMPVRRSPCPRQGHRRQAPRCRRAPGQEQQPAPGTGCCCC
jgi:hypothetical protein